MSDQAPPPPAVVKAQRPWTGREIAGLVGALLLVVVIIGAITQPSRGGENPNDYSLCSTLATSPGTDVMHAKCVDGNGDIVKYRDSVYGKTVTRLAGQ